MSGPVSSMLNASSPSHHSSLLRELAQTCHGRTPRPSWSSRTTSYAAEPAVSMRQAQGKARTAQDYPSVSIAIPRYPFTGLNDELTSSRDILSCPSRTLTCLSRVSDQSRPCHQSTSPAGTHESPGRTSRHGAPALQTYR